MLVNVKHDVTIVKHFPAGVLGAAHGHDASQPYTVKYHDHPLLPFGWLSHVHPVEQPLCVVVVEVVVVLQSYVVVVEVVVEVVDVHETIVGALLPLSVQYVVAQSLSA